jgi:hypothetical protein
VKKALLALGRARPDILPLLPVSDVAALAALPLPVEERPDRKFASADARLKSSFSKGAGGDGGDDSAGCGRASTQDLLRMLWCWAAAAAEAADTAAGGGAGAAAARVRPVLQAVLELEARPRDAAAAAVALERAGTPGQEALESFHRRLAAGKEEKDTGRRPAAAAAPAAGPAGGPEGQGARRAAPDAGLAARHRIRLLLSAPFRALRARDWFCGQCGAHNFGRASDCRRCEVPRTSLGTSTVTDGDLREMERLGVTGPGGDQLPPLRALAAAEAAGAIFNPAAREAIERKAAAGAHGGGSKEGATASTAGRGGRFTRSAEEESDAMAVSSGSEEEEEYARPRSSHQERGGPRERAERDGGYASGGGHASSGGRGRGQWRASSASRGRGRGRGAGGRRQGPGGDGDDDDDAVRYIQQLSRGSRGGRGSAGGRRGRSRGPPAGGEATEEAPRWARLFSDE